jgi:uncharacterized phage-associated protein
MYAAQAPSPPVNASDVVAYILTRLGPTQQLKLQKILFYCQAWRLAYANVPLFNDPIEARAAGPVVSSVWRNHQYEYMVESEPTGNARTLTPEQQDAVDSVLDRYAHYSAIELSRLTRAEDPWRRARDNGRRISLDAMRSYYGDIATAHQTAGTAGAEATALA